MSSSGGYTKAEKKQLKARGREYAAKVFRQEKDPALSRTRWFELMRVVLYDFGQPETTGRPPSYWHDEFHTYCNDLEINSFFGTDDTRHSRLVGPNQTLRDYRRSPLTHDELFSGNTFRRDWR